VVDGASADDVPIRPTELVELTGDVDYEVDLARLDEREGAVFRPFGLLLQKPPRLFVSSCPALFIRYTRSQRPLSRYAVRPRLISHALSLVFYPQSLIRRTIMRTIADPPTGLSPQTLGAFIGYPSSRLSVGRTIGQTGSHGRIR
jgi:hypothetical protein